MQTLARRGMSPLIATVLLMAFAVALGGMIMNWGERIVSDTTADCSQVKLQLTQFCNDGTGILLEVRNTGDVGLAALAVNISQPDLGEFAADIGSSNLAIGERISAKLPISISDQAMVRLFAKVASGREPQLCPMPFQESNPLPRC